MNKIFRTTLVILALNIVIIVLITTKYSSAATSYFVHGDEPMSLKNSIAAADTTGIVLTGPIRNGVRVNMATLTGGVLEFASSNRDKVELIYYSSATIDQTSATKDVTLAGVVRGYCWNNAVDTTTFSQCEAGKIWPKGTVVTLINDIRLYNLAAKRDLVNTMLGSGAITSNQTTQPWLFPNSVTTAERDVFTYGSALPHIIYNETLGVMQYSNGSTYYSFGSGSIVNADKGIAGKVELPSFFHYRSATGASTQLGTTGAPLVVALSDIISSSSGATQSGRVVTTNELGVFVASVGGTGTGGANISSGGILMTQGTSNMKGVYPSTSNNVLTSNGTAWTSKAPEVNVLFISTTISTATGSNINGFPVWSDESYIIPANSVAVGDVFKIEGSFEADQAGTTNLVTKLGLGSVVVATTSTNTTINSNAVFTFDGMLTVRSVGAGGSVVGGIFTCAADANKCAGGGTAQATVAFDTTADKELKVGVQFADTQASANFQTLQVMVTKYTSN